MKLIMSAIELNSGPGFVFPSAEDVKPGVNPNTSAMIQVALKSFCDNPRCEKSGEDMLRCGRCKTVYYCGASCQKNAWIIHKRICIKGRNDPFKGTTADLLRLTKTPPGPEEVVCTYVKPWGEVVSLTQREFRELSGGRTYIDYFKVRDDQWETLTALREPAAAEEADISFISMKHNDPSVIEFNKSGRPAELSLILQPGMGLGIQARGNIPICKIVDLYYGELTRRKKSANWAYSLYSSGLVDGSRYTGLGPMINDGLPNVTYMTIQDYKGIPSVVGLYSIKDIREGDLLQADYGCGHFVKLGRYTVSEADMNSMRSFFSDPKKLHLSFEECKKLLITVDYRDHACNTAYHVLTYIFSTPSAFIRLLLETDGAFYSAYKIIQADADLNKIISSDQVNNQFYCNYSTIADYIEKIRKRPDGLRLLQGLSALSEQMTASSYVTVLVRIAREKNFTFEMLASHGIFGEIMDSLYTFHHGKFSGTFLEEADEKSCEENNAKAPDITEKYRQLPLSLRLNIRTIVNMHLEAASSKEKSDKIIGFQNIISTLN